MSQSDLQIAQMKSDLSVFADPGSAILIDSEKALWEQNGNEREVSFALTQGELRVVEGSRSLRYRDFLAGPTMANLRQLADFMTRVMQSPELYIDTQARLETQAADEESTSTSGLELVRQLATEELPFLSTRLLFLRGEAGSGKTILLRELARRQAQLVATGGDFPLFLYVDAQGRSLARLEEAIAKELGNLRASFSDSAVATLTRHGLLVPIIDGFDELLGSGGYDDAFSSLNAFIATLEGYGAVIASARSSFYYGVLREHAGRYEGNTYKLETIVVLNWAEQQVREYIADVAGEGVSTVALQPLVNNSGTARLLSKPFYASSVARLLAEGYEFDSSTELLDQLVAAFLEREVGKLTDKQGHPLLDLAGHREFVSQIALEMWWLENQALDVETVRVIAEMIAEERGLSPLVAKSLLAKVESYAFLSPEGRGKGRLGFEHEVFYGYFLARSLSKWLVEGGADLRRFLARSVMEETLVQESVRDDRVRQDTSRCIMNICQAIRPVLAEMLSRENGGRLIGALLRSSEGTLERLRIANVIMREEGLGQAKLIEPVFSSCDLYRVDLTSATVVRAAFEGSALRDLIVGDVTDLSGSTISVGEDLFGILVRQEGGGLKRVDSPAQMAAVLKSHGAIVPGFEEEVGFSDSVQARVDDLDKVIRLFERQYYVSPDDGLAKDLMSLDHWSELNEKLRRFGLLETKTVSKSGTSGDLWRLAVPPDVLRRGLVDKRTVPANVAAFWKAVTVGTT